MVFFWVQRTPTRDKTTISTTGVFRFQFDTGWCLSQPEIPQVEDSTNFHHLKDHMELDDVTQEMGNNTRLANLQNSWQFCVAAALFGDGEFT